MIMARDTTPAASQEYTLSAVASSGTNEVIRDAVLVVLNQHK